MDLDWNNFAQDGTVKYWGGGYQQHSNALSCQVLEGMLVKGRTVQGQQQEKFLAWNWPTLSASWCSFIK